MNTMNKEFYEGLFKIRDGIDSILSSVEVAEEKAPVSAPSPVKEKKTNKVKRTPAIPATKDEPASAVPEQDISAEALKGMSYNGIKKLASSIGLSAKGSRAEIEARILGSDSEDEAPEEKVEKSAKKKTASKPGPKKLGKKSAEPEPDPEPAEVDEVTQQVRDVTEDMSTEEIADFLVSCELSAKGKRETLIARLVKSVKSGDIVLDDDDGEDESGSDEPEDSSEPDTAEEEEDNTNDLDNPDMTKKRKKAIKEYSEEVKDSVKSGEMTRKDEVEFLQGYYNDDDEYSGSNDDEVTELYLDAACRFIDDAGVFVEEESTPYSVNGNNYCCGFPLKYSEDTNNFICEKCGTEYEAE